MDGNPITLWNVPLLAAAAFALSRLWFQGSLFATALEKAKFRADDLRWYVRKPNELLTCPLCLSSQILLFCSLCLVLPQAFLPEMGGLLCRWTLYTAAAAALIPVDYIAPRNDL